ncbi:structural maintenance of chromosomes flexible hinge domain-containing protein GMI1 isoform X2 [Mercurialis annua]|nr:structural maintenance of chromosomes flexible hinge domain-containing protein GMI1 isoform X2 [Mercurialis annua]XP_050237469.1 structural maintenance of chromosomes flexible hinge domain-containing protein GMI1 isoform X2 [Mercurialis annua]XP_050237470.1 structural maintenance of chromosomes flexible hinge domain-containing protein GMI1 isoform X2 [Mercurialis annua]
MKYPDIRQLQCRLKDIYFPYIQCDDPSNKGKTVTPITFQVNGVDLAEVEGGEVSITNLHSCNGSGFVFQLHFSVKQDMDGTRTPGKCSKASQKANAQLKCFYFPIVEGKESIENILGRLKDEGCGIPENFETFSRVSVRRLGRLLPDARWARLPFMEFNQKKGDRAHLLKRFCSRVKCFIETDAGFSPTPSKTDLAHHNPFTSALKNFGSKKLDKEKEVNIQIFRDGKLLSPLVFEKEYQEWIFQMHEYDQEVDSGEDDAVLVVNPTNKKGLGIASDVVRVHQGLKRKGAFWKSGQKIKILKGACPGVQKTNIYATIEYLLIEGFQGDAGGDARIICRPLDVADDDGCTLAVKDGNASLNIHRSLSLPISVVDSGKCIAVDTAEWNNQLEKQRMKAPSIIDFLSAEHCRELEVNGALPFSATVDAGQVPPSEIVAVVRPASFISSNTSNNLDQKYIVKSNSEMSMGVQFRRDTKDRCVEPIYSTRITSSCRKGIGGLYIFSLVPILSRLFRESGVYTFSFSLVGSSVEDFKKSVKVRASSAVGKWKLLHDNGSRPCTMRVGSAFQTLGIACYDKFGNRMPFVSLPAVTVKLNFHTGLSYDIDNVKTRLSSDKLTLEVKELLIESARLDEIRPNYEATLLICPQDNLATLSVQCKVVPGSLDHVVVNPPLLEKQLLPGFVVKELLLEMFDKYGNHVRSGLGVQLNLDGFQILDQIGSNRKVDDKGCIDLSGLLKVTAGYGKTDSILLHSAVSISVSSNDRVILKEEFQTGKRELRLASNMPESLVAGSQLENVEFQVVDSVGDVDETIHDEEKFSQSHTLKIISNTFDSVGIQYTFRFGCATVPVIPVPANEGNYSFTAAHTRYPELQLSFNVSVTENLDYNEFQSPCSDRQVLLLQDSASLKHLGNLTPHDNEGNLMLSIVNTGQPLQDEIGKYGERIGDYEKKLKLLDDMKLDRESSLSKLQASIGPEEFSYMSSVSTKEEITEQIKSRSHSAAAKICSLSIDFPFQESQNHFMQDIVGLVALLGTVGKKGLSRVLAEYLGEDQMLAVVCRSYEAATALEKFITSEKSTSGRFLVISLEDLRVYRYVEEDAPQRTLAFPEPMLPSGNAPPGFEGYAVNMIHLDMEIRSGGHRLRETLFYQLLGELQVYKSKEHMNNARACITQGAVSLDGGIIRENGIISLGYGNPEICFPVEMDLSLEMIEVKLQIAELREQLQEIAKSIEKVSRLHEKAMRKFKKRSAQFENFIGSLDQTKTEPN